ncbi:unnamed protein product [Diatraea saccharalis]|uniref:Uncharacterized protein n=1 Tax=Diatraea saccharalis TaxID=40085 RepID=A0A9N9QZS5_9NEOP|nr:unnamed protein product [Diatraea saccharalis]
MWLGSTISSAISEKIYNKNLVTVTTLRKVFQSISLFGIAIALVVLSFFGPEQKYLAVATAVVCLTAEGFSTAGFIVNQLDLSPNYAGVIMCLLNCIVTLICAVIPIITSAILRNDSVSNIPY